VVPGGSRYRARMRPGGSYPHSLPGEVPNAVRPAPGPMQDTRGDGRTRNCAVAGEVVRSNATQHTTEYARSTKP
jgi:hypothetical protein